MSQRSTRTFAILAISAILLVAAVGTSVATQQVSHDSENPAYVGNVTTESGAYPRIVHDPDNPYWIGATVSSDTFEVLRTRGPR
jgi:hypothetical protein